VAQKDWKVRLRELYLPSTKDFVFVDVPEMRFVMSMGKGGSMVGLTPPPCGGSSRWLIRSGGSPRNGWDGISSSPRWKDCGGQTMSTISK